MIKPFQRDFAPPIKRKDPFSPYFGYRKRKIRDLFILFSAGLIFFFFLAYSFFNRGTYAILLDGKVAAYVKNRKRAHNVVAEVKKLARGKGELKEKITIEKVSTRQEALSPEEAYLTIKKRVHIMIPAYLFTFSKKIAFAVENKEELLSFLESFKKNYCQRIIPPPFEAAYALNYSLIPAKLSVARVKSITEIKKAFFTLSAPLLPVVCRKKQKIQEDIPFQTEVVPDPSLYSDIRLILQEGVPGKVEKEVLFVYVNGQVKEKKVVKEKVLFPPVAKKIKMGTRRKPSLSSRSHTWSLEKLAYNIYQQYRHGNEKGKFRGVYGMQELGVSVATAHSLNHAFGVHYAYSLSWPVILKFLQHQDTSFGGRWGCAGGPHDPSGAAQWLQKFLKKVP